MHQPLGISSGLDAQARLMFSRLRLTAAFETHLQVPQFLLQAGYGRVACTQPRRISAMGLCRRVSYETLHEHGSEVAYQVRQQCIIMRWPTTDRKIDEYNHKEERG